MTVTSSSFRTGSDLTCSELCQHCTLNRAVFVEECVRSVEGADGKPYIVLLAQFLEDQVSDRTYFRHNTAVPC
jgi:hypothetical protein